MQDPIEIPTETYNKKDWLYFGIAMFFLCLEFYYMWDWCQWFTKCR